MRKFINAVVVVVAFAFLSTIAAHAGELEDRQNLAFQKVIAKPLSRCYAPNLAGSTESYNSIRSFLSVHRPASDVKCDAYKIDCECIGTFCHAASDDRGNKQEY